MCTGMVVQLELLLNLLDEKPKIVLNLLDEKLKIANFHRAGSLSLDAAIDYPSGRDIIYV
jgi:hypothetical protein